MMNKDLRITLFSMRAGLDLILVNINTIAIEMRRLGPEYDREFRTACEIHKNMIIFQMRLNKIVQDAQKLDTDRFL